MKKIIYFIMFVLLISLVSADCLICNETCTPCSAGPGGLCTTTDLSWMFQDLTNFDTIVGDITGWNTSCITSMTGLFYSATDDSDFNQDIGGWDVSSVTDMSEMFNGAKVFNQDISAWDVSNVVSMNSMFAFATDFNQPIGSWNTTSVIDMYAVFWLAIAFDQDISNWNISQITSAGSMFNGVTLSTTNYDALLNGWAAQTVQSSVTFDGGNSQYSPAALSARNNTLIGVYGWTINDGGLTNWITYDDFSTFNTSKWEEHMGSASVSIDSGALIITGYSGDGDWGSYYGGILSKEGFDFSQISALRIKAKITSTPPYTQFILMKGNPDCGNARGSPSYTASFSNPGTSELQFFREEHNVACDYLGQTMGPSYTNDTYYWIVFTLNSDASLQASYWTDSSGPDTLIWNSTKTEFMGYRNKVLNLTISEYATTIVIDQIDVYVKSPITTCYQEYANVSEVCGARVGYEYPLMNVNVIDGDWLTGSNGNLDSNSGLFIDYLKPIYSYNATLIYSIDGITNVSVSIPQSCWNYNATNLFISFRAYDNIIKCYNGTGSWTNRGSTPPENYYYGQIWSWMWTTIDTTGTSMLYENGINWEVTGAPECAADSDCQSCEICNLTSNTCYYEYHTDIKTDCSLCKWCDGDGSCVGQDLGFDIKNECPSTIYCAGTVDDITAPPSSYWNISGCGLYGFCRSPSWFPVSPSLPVSEGNICIDGSDYDVTVTASNYCSIVKDCVIDALTADEYYIGYEGYAIDWGSPPVPEAAYTCSLTNWQPAGVWSVPSGYKINVTEIAVNCSITKNDLYINVTPNNSEEIIFVAENISNIENITNLAIEAPTVSIVIDFTGSSVNYTNVDTNAVVITERTVSIDTTLSPELDKPARLTFSNVGSDYVIYRDDVLCGSYCSNIIYSGRTLSFDVTGFSTYYVGAAAAKGCEDTKLLVFAAFALIAIIIIVTAAFALINFSNLDALTTIAISSIGLAIVLFVGYFIISAVQTAICSV